jgi:threonine dehydratase
VRGKKLLAIICGANMDFGKLALISSQSAVGAHRRKYLRMHIAEGRGSLLGLLENLLPDINVSEFQYGKTSETDGWPVMAFEATPARLGQLFDELKSRQIPYQDITGDADARYRIIPYNPALFTHPLFFHVHFPERRGALRDFLRRISGVASLCYFNYAYTGESIGRALMGFSFASPDDHAQFMARMEGSPVTLRPLDQAVVGRMLQA